MKSKLLTVALLCALFLLGGCRAVKEVETVYRTDTLRIVDKQVVRESVDSMRWRDRERRGDTVFVLDSVRIRWRYDSVVHDTVADVRVERVTEVKREEVVKRSGYDRFCSWGFWVLAVLAVVVLVIVIMRRVRR